MIEKIFNSLTSYRTTLFLFVVYAILMATATILEKFYGTSVAKGIIYYSPLFFIIQLLLCAAFVCTSIQKRLFTVKKWHYSLLHGAFIIILAGAGVTHFWGKEGIIHLREGEKCDFFWLKEGNVQAELPFELELQDFKLIRYPGSLSPSSYESYLKIYTTHGVHETKVYMNNVLDIEGYRFFQASYDEDERGSVLSVSYDSMGRNITYFGYICLFIGLVGCMFSSNSRFMSARRRLSRLTVSAMVAAIMSLGGSMTCNANDIPQHHLDAFGRLTMQSANGRMIPVNTFAEELLKKFDMHNGLSISSEQLLLEIITDAPKWANTPIIPIENKDIKHKYGWVRDRISYRDVFSEEGKYILADDIAFIHHKLPEQRNNYDKDMIKLDERINIVHQLFNFQLLRIFPSPDGKANNLWLAAGDDLSIVDPITSDTIRSMFDNYRASVQMGLDNKEWSEADKALETIDKYQKAHGGYLINEKKIKAEIIYNKHNFFDICKKIDLIAGGLLLILTFYSWFYPNSFFLRRVKRLLVFCIGTGLLIHSCTLILRWYISGYAPWSNSYETMVSIAWVSAMGGILFSKRDSMMCALATLLGGIALFVSELNWMDPQITPLVPVLKSPWLMFHVAALMASYGFLGICCLIGTINLVLTKFSLKYEIISIQIKRLTLINEMLLIIGLIFMVIGIFLGAVWANESWGRYWGWDPKETWALISMIVYAFILHVHWFYPTTNSKRFNLLSQLGFLSVLMTYFGVNYFLNGMHSYGNTSSLSSVNIAIFIAVILFFTIPGIIAYYPSKNLYD